MSVSKLLPLPCVWDRGEPDIKELVDIADKKIKRAFGDEYPNLEKISERVSYSSGYARRTARGILKEGYSFTGFELAIIFDGGFNFFGGEAFVNGRMFIITVYTD